MKNNMYKRRIVISIDCNLHDKIIDLVQEHGVIRVPFIDINKISVFSDRISIQYKKASIATYRGNEKQIRTAMRLLEQTDISMRNAS